MIRRLAFFVALLVPSVATTTERMIGLVEVAAFHEISGKDGQDIPRGPVVLYVEPNIDAKIAVVVRDHKHLESREHSYEQVSAVVYDRTRNSGGDFWYKLRYFDGEKEIFGWLSQTDAGKFRSYPDIVVRDLTYLSADWDKRLFERPDTSAPFRQFEELGEYPDVRVADVKYVNEDVWFLVVVVDGNICTGGGTNIIATGWVLAYAENGSATVWYYSRGC
ncbi:MAG: hypothetical protein KOO62_10110 [candidate division Zixibacteria bacterium]|nr:hypothetical protein [candidate division Zixibacteria bacterium]